jgi:hypothetical protein
MGGLFVYFHNIILKGENNEEHNLRYI